VGYVPRPCGAVYRGRVPVGVLSKISARGLLVDRVRALIVEQVLAPGVRINESQLSAQLGVSRTPLREALSLLEGESLVRSEHDRGFFVPALSTQEIAELYPIGRALDLLALREARHYSDATIGELDRINKKFLKAKRDPGAAQGIDTEFHHLLIAGCPNQRLLRTLAPIKAAMERYERLYMSDVSDVTRSAAHHTRIIEALKAGNIDEAASALSDNWTYGFERLLLLKL
jgi:DNA-binding GntR family transcriptional regulator